MKRLFRYFVGFTLVALIFMACDDIYTSVQNSADSETGCAVRLYLSDSSRSALPDVGILEFESFMLKGSKDGENAKILGEYSSFAELTSAQLDISAGKWIFTLEAVRGSAKYSDTTECNIVLGDNVLVFCLKLSSLNNGDVSGSGSFSISLSLPDAVDGVTASLFLVNSDGSAGEEAGDALELAVSEKVATYSLSQVASGNYVAVFSLYSGGLKVGTWREYVGIATGCESRSKATVAAVDVLYAINYNSVLDGTLRTAPGSFTRHEPVTADDIIPFCEIPNWYTDESYTKKFESTAGLSENIELWAEVDTGNFLLDFDLDDEGSLSDFAQ